MRKKDFLREIKRIKAEFRSRKYFILHFRKKSAVQDLYVRLTKSPSSIFNTFKGLKCSIKEIEAMMQNEGFWMKFQFIWMGYKYEPWSVLQSFDLESCQIGFDGQNVLCTFAFLQCIQTKTVIDYKLTTENYKGMRQRTMKYLNRGFKLLVPLDFNDENVNVGDDEELELIQHRIQKKKKKIEYKLYSMANIPNMFRLNNDCFGVRRQFINFLKFMGGQTNKKLLQIHKAKMKMIQTDDDDYDEDEDDDLWQEMLFLFGCEQDENVDIVFGYEDDEDGDGDVCF